METDFHILRSAAARAGAQGPDGDVRGPGKFLRVEVADTGPGFPEDGIDRVFEPFFTTKPRGSGLGHALSERLVAVHGGDIRAVNRRHGGAAITVTLPVSA
jgi:signal transduction histidine kinase